MAEESGPRPKYPVLVIKGTNKWLAVEIGEDIFASSTRVWLIENTTTGCLKDPDITSYDCNDANGNDVGLINITSGYITA